MSAVESELGVVAESGQKDCAEGLTFESLGVCQELCAACEELGWTSPTPIQREAIPLALAGHDVVAVAETGSGKTGAFALPIIQKLLDSTHRNFAVVLAPTRELCVQIADCFAQLGRAVSLSAAVLVGGMDMAAQVAQLARGPHIIVATPGRLIDHLENTKGFHLRSVKCLVLDEADRLLSMDFEDALDKLLQVLPRERQSFLFSATMTSRVSKLKRASLRSPRSCVVSSKNETVANLVQRFQFVPHKYKQAHLVALLARNSHCSAIVFAETCLNAQKLALMLKHLGVSAAVVHGQLAQSARLAALNQFRAARHRVLVATDVAARGLDIPAVDLVVNYELPLSCKDYIHRVGRTARAGRSGLAVALVTQYDVERFQRIEEFLGRKMDEEPADEPAALKLHSQVLEAMRSAHLDIKNSAPAVRNGKNKRKTKK